MANEYLCTCLSSPLVKNDTTPIFEDICARVLASHIICEKEGSFTVVAIILLGLQRCGRRCHAQEEAKYLQRWFYTSPKCDYHDS